MIGLLISGLFLIRSYPIIFSLIYTEIGSRGLNEALSEASLSSNQLAQAAANFQIAILYNPKNSYSHRLLGQVNFLLGDTQAAIEHQKKFIELRPKNPMGYWEISQSYEAIYQEWSKEIIFDFVKESFHSIETDIDTQPGNCHGKLSPQSITYQPIVGLYSFDDVSELTIIQNTPGSYSYEVELPANPAVLSIRPYLIFDGPESAGVEALVEVEIRQVGDAHPAIIYHANIYEDFVLEKPIRIILDEYRGERVSISLRFRRVYPLDDRQVKVGWIAPIIYPIENIFDEARAFEAFQNLVDLWQKANYSSQDFINFGIDKRQSGDVNEAIKWHRRATYLAPDLTETWFELGLSYVANDQYPEALTAFETALSTPSSDIFPTSEIYYQMGLIYVEANQETFFQYALYLFDNALRAQKYSSTNSQAETHYKKGEIYNRLGASQELVIKAFEEAISINAGHYWAHLRLGIALYQNSNDLREATALIDKAIEIWPEQSHKKWPYIYLGDIYNDAGLEMLAIEAYETGLEFDHTDPELLNRLENLMTE